MKIKKICRYLLISSLIAVLCGCSYANNRNFTFSIENGDAIKVKKVVLLLYQKMIIQYHKVSF